MSVNLNSPEYPFNIDQEQLSLALSEAKLGCWQIALAAGNQMNCTDQCKLNFGWDTTMDFSYQDMLDCILPDDLCGMKEAVDLAVRSSRPYYIQYRVRHRDGSVHWIEARGTVILKAGVPVSLLGTTLDITDKKDIELLRDELLSVAMHELKTPLSTVKSSLQIIERHLQGQGDEKVQKIASRALTSAERINRLLQDMAAPFMARSKEMLLIKDQFDLRRLADEVADNAILINPKTSITVHAESEQLPVYADRHRIAQVLINLVNNAVKYSPGNAVISLTLAHKDGHVQVSVTDQGAGIPKEDRAMIFRKFYRSGKIRHSVDGLGIGLFLCWEIISRHGGQIGIAENEGPGTIIFFTLLNFLEVKTIEGI